MLLLVTFDVLVELGFPEIKVALGRVGETTTGMAMPVAAMHQNYRASARQNDVGPARQVLPVKTEPVAHPVQQ